jgi:hypothetical protein
LERVEELIVVRVGAGELRIEKAPALEGGRNKGYFS